MVVSLESLANYEETLEKSISAELKAILKQLEQVKNDYLVGKEGLRPSKTIVAPIRAKYFIFYFKY